MNRTQKLIGLIVISLMAAAVVLLPARAQETKTPGRISPPTQGPASGLNQERREQLLDKVSAMQGVSRENLATGDIVTQKNPFTGTEITQAKFIDKATGEIYGIAVDAEGDTVDPETATKNENQAKALKYGKIDPGLQKKMDAVEGSATDEVSVNAVTAGNGSLPVSIWLNVPDAPLVRQKSATDPYIAQSNLSDHLASLEYNMTSKRQGILKTLTRMSANVRYSKYGPAVFANLTPKQIRDIAKRTDVDTIYSGQENYKLFGDDASTTQRVYPVWASGNLGQLGAGMVRPVVHESDGVYDANPFLNNGTHAVIFWCTPGQPGCPLGKNNVGSTSDKQHATWVAGVISSTHPLFRGMAPNSQVILSANSQDFSDANIVDAFEWARNNGGDPTNMSWGTVCGGGNQNFVSRYMDWAVRNLFATIVISAGNRSNCSTLLNPNADIYVSSPGLAWSVITVGSQFDNNNGFWAGDVMSTFSRYVNPTFAPGMEKPEVVAVGQNVMTTDNQGGDHVTATGVSGTSFSAPMVAGQVALMLSRQPGQNQWPETNKAAVLASAFQDIEAGTSRDGVGSVVISQSDDTYRLGRFRNDCGLGCVPLQAANFPRNYPVALSAGQVVRAAIAWDSTSTIGSDVLGADLDLQIISPTGAVVASSASFQNAWELAQFIAPVTGTYTFRVNRFSSITGWPGTYLGMAYSIRNLPDFCTGVAVGPGTFAVNTVNGPTWFDSYAGWIYNQSGREYIRRIDVTTIKDINITDTNPNIDLHLIRIPSCAANPIVPTVVANGTNSIFVNNAPVGSYYVVADGFNGTVGTTTLSISLTGP